MAIAAACVWLAPGLAAACPFCNAVALTFTEEMNTNDVAVIATLKKTAGKSAADDLVKSQFEVVDILKGGDHLPKSDSGHPMIEVLYFGRKPIGTPFLIMAANPPALNWGAPIPLTEHSVAYVKQLPGLPAKGIGRLRFFMAYLEDAEDLLQRDAYDEFAKAPYSEIAELKKHLRREELIEWIKDPEVSNSHRRLYLTMLGVCGKPEDARLLEEILKTKTDEPRAGLDAVIACYLTLKGADGMPLIEKLFLSNNDAEYTDTYAAIMALRFHGQEEKTVPKERLLEGFRHMLKRPKLADLVIPDLARAEDWSVIDQLTELFKQADSKSSWVRVPVIQYLRACPLPKAKRRLEELSKLDPEAIKRASFFLPLGGGDPPKIAPPDKGKAPNDKDSDDTDSAAPDKKQPAKPGVEVAPKASKKTGEKPAANSGAAAISPLRQWAPAAAVGLIGGFGVLLAGRRRRAVMRGRDS